MPTVDPIGSGRDYSADVVSALKFQPILAAGDAASLPELAVRYVISNPALSTMEIGIATLDELKLAADAVNKGPLSNDVLSQIRDIQVAIAAA